MCYNQIQIVLSLRTCSTIPASFFTASEVWNLWLFGYSLTFSLIFQMEESSFRLLRVPGPALCWYCMLTVVTDGFIAEFQGLLILNNLKGVLTSFNRGLENVLDFCKLCDVYDAVSDVKWCRQSVTVNKTLILCFWWNVCDINTVTLGR